VLGWLFGWLVVCWDGCLDGWLCVGMVVSVFGWLLVCWDRCWDGGKKINKWFFLRVEKNK
jgi:hypothetical protein